MLAVVGGQSIALSLAPAEDVQLCAADAQGYGYGGYASPPTGSYGGAASPMASMGPSAAPVAASMGPSASRQALSSSDLTQVR